MASTVLSGGPSRACTSVSRWRSIGPSVLLSILIRTRRSIYAFSLANSGKTIDDMFPALKEIVSCRTSSSQNVSSKIQNQMSRFVQSNSMAVLENLADYHYGDANLINTELERYRTAREDIQRVAKVFGQKQPCCIAVFAKGEGQRGGWIINVKVYLYLICSLVAFSLSAQVTIDRSKHLPRSCVSWNRFIRKFSMKTGLKVFVVGIKLPRITSLILDHDLSWKVQKQVITAGDLIGAGTVITKSDLDEEVDFMGPISVRPTPSVLVDSVNTPINS